MNNPFKHNVPPISPEMMRALEERFSHQQLFPRQSDDEWMIWVNVGKRFVVDYLRDQFDQQQDNILKG